MNKFKTSLVNLPSQISVKLTTLMLEEKLASYRFASPSDLQAYFLTHIPDIDLVVAYERDVKETDIPHIQATSDIPIVLITNNVCFEMERTAKANGIDLIIDENNDELISLVFGFIRQYRIYQNYKALIVDDSRVDSQLISCVLDLDFINNTIENQSENVVARIEEDPSINIVVLDYEMPNLNGCLLMQNIKTLFPERPFLFLGFTGSRNGAIKFLNAGADNVFTKPLDTEIFSINLRKLIFNAYLVQQEKKTLNDYQSFLSRISYDISNPLYILMSINDLFIEGKSSQQSIETIKKLSGQSKQNLNHVLNGLLEYIELTSQQKSASLKACSLHSMIATQLFLETEQVKVKNLIINKKYNIEAVALCIPHQIESVITYFTQNAINNATPGGEIDVRLYIENNDIHFEVEDSAKRIPVSELKNLFKEPDDKAELKPVRDEHSLDLTLCREVIHNHGGEIGVKYGERGNVFFFKLPSDQSLQTETKH